MTPVHALNIIASLLYISLAGATMFLLKLATQPLLRPYNNNQKAKQPQESSKIYRRMAVSWFKKYSIIGSITLSDRKYLAKQLLITSVYGVSCLKINKITLWPVALITFLLPAIFFLYELVFKLQKNCKKESQSKNTNQVNIQIECEVVEGTKVVQNRQIPKNQKQNKQNRNLYQLILISIFAFIAVVLQLQTVMVLGKSISNSGQLNLISVFCIVLMDQFLLRPFSGLIFVGTFKLLQYKSIVSLHQNKLVFFLCQQILREEQIEEQIKRARAQLQSTQSHLKSNEEEVARETNVPMKPSIGSMVFIDLDHIKPYEKQISSPHEALCQSKVIDEEQIYLTTPQKQLFEVDIYGNNQQTIINSSLCNKENAQNINNNNSQSLYQQNEKKQINCFEQLIVTRDHEPLKNLSNLEPTFKTQHQHAEEQKKKTLNKKKNRRVLKLTGNSPYLQYLPNMLKNVRKAQTTAVTTDVTTAPKLAELNFR